MFVCPGCQVEPTCPPSPDPPASPVWAATSPSGRRTTKPASVTSPDAQVTNRLWSIRTGFGPGSSCRVVGCTWFISSVLTVGILCSEFRF